MGGLLGISFVQKNRVKGGTIDEIHTEHYKFLIMHRREGKAVDVYLCAPTLGSVYCIRVLVAQGVRR